MACSGKPAIRPRYRASIRPCGRVPDAPSATYVSRPHCALAALSRCRGPLRHSPCCICSSREQMFTASRPRLEAPPNPWSVPVVTAVSAPCRAADSLAISGAVPPGHAPLFVAVCLATAVAPQRVGTLLPKPRQSWLLGGPAGGAPVTPLNKLPRSMAAWAPPHLQHPWPLCLPTSGLHNSTLLARCSPESSSHCSAPCAPCCKLQKFSADAPCAYCYNCCCFHSGCA